MTNYSKLSELYYQLDGLILIHRDISNAQINLQTKDHIFKIDISPRVNSKVLTGCKIKYKNQLLAIVDGEIKETKQIIATLLSSEE